jgi:hypothetical protein
MTTPATNATQIAAELKRRIDLIRTDADVPYLTNIGAKVFRGKVRIDDDLVPCTSIIEGEDHVQSTPGRSALWKIGQRYALVGYAQCDPDNPNDTAHQIIRDFKRAVFWTNGKPTTDLGGLALEVHYKGRQIGPRADGAAIVMAIVEIEVVYIESPTES